jgi:SAM-dependent methyltransferase
VFVSLKSIWFSFWSFFEEWTETDARMSDASIYSGKRYWDDRYRDGPFGDTGRGIGNEWLVPYCRWRDLLLRDIKTDARVLLVGIGLSTLAEDMASDGFARLTACDYSEVCIARWHAWQAETGKHAVSYQTMDVLALPVAESSFDAIVDKATLDTLCQDDEDSDSSDDGNQGERVRANQHSTFAGKRCPDSPARRMLAECVRVLAPGGRFVSLSYEGKRPAFIRTQAGWQNAVRLNQATLVEARAHILTHALARTRILTRTHAQTHTPSTNPMCSCTNQLHTAYAPAIANMRKRTLARARAHEGGQAGIFRQTLRVDARASPGRGLDSASTALQRMVSESIVQKNKAQYKYSVCVKAHETSPAGASAPQPAGPD